MGAQDFRIKSGYSSTLPERAVRYGIERKDAEQLIKASEESYCYLKTGMLQGTLNFEPATFLR